MIFNSKTKSNLENNAKKTFFHSEEYYNVLKKTDKLNPLSVVSEENNKICGYALGEYSNQYKMLSVFTARTIFYSEPLYDSPDVLDNLLKKIKKQKTGLFVQIRPFEKVSGEIQDIYIRNKFFRLPHYNAYIVLDDMDSVFKNFEKDKRRGINLAEKKYGIIINEPDDTLNSVKAFYDMISKLFKENNLGLKSFEYFSNLVNLSNGKVRIAFAYYNNIPVATQLYIINNDKISALYTATIKEHRSKYAGDLLIWYLIKSGFENKLKIFDFGGAGRPDRPYPPREYKKRFGTIFEDVGRFTYFKYPFSRNLLDFYYKYTS